MDNTLKHSTSTNTNVGKHILEMQFREHVDREHFVLGGHEHYLAPQFKWQPDSDISSVLVQHTTKNPHLFVPCKLW